VLPTPVGQVVAYGSMFGMVASTTILDRLFHTDDSSPTREHVINQMTTFWVRAMRAEPA